MSRKKVKLQWIANDAARRATFKKRRRGLMKKVQELSILCNVKACTVVYGPYEPQPEVWPCTEEAAALLRGFRGMPEHEQGRRRMDQESFLRQRVEKLREQVEKEKKVAREVQAELLMSDCLEGKRRVEDLTMEETTTLGCLVEMKLTLVQARIELLRAQRQAAVAPTSAAIMETSMPSFHLKPPSSPLLPPSPPLQVVLQTSSCYLPPLPAPLQQPPPYNLWMEVAPGHKQLTDQLYGASSTSVHARPTVQQASLLDQAAAAAAMGVKGVRRSDWLMEMMGPYSHLIYEGEGLAAPPLMDDTKSTCWMMDPYLPFN
ncbi:hypothetical protein Taro_023737 [Colocasia esculenta]|uniref:MADS-box domain-containing protein n=1 Tax=Colocasia esculenta TaxID=4460 RepID=A0A843VI78_COLES|nr:hypothetical protein [Colocasia esculenta]